jgi:Ca2+-binding RTX toxin-like protein
VTSVFGTLSVRPSVAGYEQYRYFRYPNGEEHIYDIVADPGETTNLIASAPLEFLRSELVRGALDLGLDLCGYENPADGVNAMMAVDGSVVLEGTRGGDSYWAYGADAEKIREAKNGGNDTLWYMGGPDNYVLHCPMNVENIRIATVVARNETNPKGEGRTLRIVAHPDSPIHFETSERVLVDVRGSRGDDVLIGPKYGGATFYGGEGDDSLIAIAKLPTSRHAFFGGAGNDHLQGGGGRDTLDGGTGDDTIYAGDARNLIFAGHGNDWIEGGDNSSIIHTGPGRNHVKLGRGNDTLHTGTGVSHVMTAGGNTVFLPAYGGVTLVNRWAAGQVYDFSAWPQKPSLNRHGDVAEFTLGLSILRVLVVGAGADVLAQMRWGPGG